MLSKKDLQAIRTIIQEELKELVMQEWVMEVGPDKPGDPPKHREKRTVNVLHEIGMYIPNLAAATRGMQEDIERNTNKVNKLGAALCSFEKPLIGLAEAAQKLEMPEAQLIESDS